MAEFQESETGEYGYSHCFQQEELSLSCLCVSYITLHLLDEETTILDVTVKFKWISESDGKIL